MNTLRTLPVLFLLAAGLAPLAPLDSQAGPILRRAQERKACQEFAGKLQATSGNPQQAQLVYQQGVLKLVETFGENPCGDIPAPVAAAPAPAATVSPVTAPATAKPANPQQVQACQEFAGKLQATSGNPQQAQLVYQQGVLKLVETFGENPCGDIPAPTAAAPATPAPAPVTAPVTAKPANPQQAQACQEFASKLQGAQGNPAQAQQIYAMGTQKLSGMFGPNPCPNVPKP